MPNIKNNKKVTVKTKLKAKNNAKPAAKKAPAKKLVPKKTLAVRGKKNSATKSAARRPVRTTKINTKKSLVKPGVKKVGRPRKEAAAALKKVSKPVKKLTAKKSTRVSKAALLRGPKRVKQASKPVKNSLKKSALKQRGRPKKNQLPLKTKVRSVAIKLTTRTRTSAAKTEQTKTRLKTVSKKIPKPGVKKVTATRTIVKRAPKLQPVPARKITATKQPSSKKPGFKPKTLTAEVSTQLLRADGSSEFELPEDNLTAADLLTPTLFYPDEQVLIFEADASNSFAEIAEPGSRNSAAATLDAREQAFTDSETEELELSRFNATAQES